MIATLVPVEVATIAQSIAASYVPFGDRPAPVDHAAVLRADVARLSAEVAANNTTISRLRYDTSQLRSTVDEWRSDVDTIGRMLIDAAQENSMCGVYDRTIEEINRELSVASLPPRNSNFTVEVTVTITVEIEDVRDDDAAAEAANEAVERMLDRSSDVDSYDITDTEVSAA